MLRRTILLGGAEMRECDEEQIRETLLGRTVTRVSDDTLLLDNGTTLRIVPNEGCGGCNSGWYDIVALNDCPVIIT